MYLNISPNKIGIDQQFGKRVIYFTYFKAVYNNVHESKE